MVLERLDSALVLNCCWASDNTACGSHVDDTRIDVRRRWSQLDDEGTGQLAGGMAGRDGRRCSHLDEP